MSERIHDDSKTKGSNSSTGSRNRRTRHSRSRSRSFSPPLDRSKTTRRKHHESSRMVDHRDDKGQKIYDTFTDSDDSLSGSPPLPPPPPIISKVSFGMKKTETPTKSVAKTTPQVIQIKLPTAPKQQEAPKKLAVASAFANDSDDDDVEEMPAECRMRMRNIGRDTPTSSGPNSFGKTKQGFCDSKKIFERTLKGQFDKKST